MKLDGGIEMNENILDEETKKYADHLKNKIEEIRIRLEEAKKQKNNLLSELKAVRKRYYVVKYGKQADRPKKYSKTKNAKEDINQE